jgi:hypothetical protein
VENNPIRFTDPDGMAVSYDNFGNVTYTGEDAQNFARGIQAYVGKVVGNALAFAGIGGGKGGGSGSSSGPPKEGDKDKKGNIYSEAVKQYLPPDAYNNLRQWEEKLRIDNNNFYYSQAQEDRRAGDAGVELGWNFFKFTGFVALSELEVAEFYYLARNYSESNPNSEIDFKRLQELVGKDSQAMNKFFKSNGEEVPDRQALERYKELIMRMLDKSKGAYQRVAPAAYRTQVERLKMINDALKNMP